MNIYEVRTLICAQHFFDAEKSLESLHLKFVYYGEGLASR